MTIRALFRVMEILCRSLVAVTLAVMRMIAARATGSDASSRRIFGSSCRRLCEDLGPAFVKVGQLLSTRYDLLPNDVIEQLQPLRDEVSADDSIDLPNVIHSAFGVPFDDIFSHVDPRPIGTGSVAVVWRARLRCGRQVVLKVRRPHVMARLTADLELLKWGGAWIARLPVCRSLPVEQVLNELADSVARQVDFTREVEVMDQVRLRLDHESELLIPQVLPELCCASVITMELIVGERPAALQPERRAEVARIVLRSLYQMMFAHGILHCDLHPGNVLVCSDGRVCLIDFGFSATLTDSHRLLLAKLFYAMFVNDVEACVSVVLGTATNVPSDLDMRQLRLDIGAVIHGASGVSVQRFQVAAFVGRLFAVQRRHGIAGSAAFGLAVAALLMLEGFVKQVAPAMDFQKEAVPFVFRASLKRPGTFSGARAS